MTRGTSNVALRLNNVVELGRTYRFRLYAKKASSPTATGITLAIAGAEFFNFTLTDEWQEFVIVSFTT